jgi:hypothetical protein
MNMIQSDILRINYNSNPNANRDFIWWMEKYFPLRI